LGCHYRPELDQPIGQATVGNLEIKMDPRAVVPDLLVDVRVALGWGKAAEFRVPRPRVPERPTQHRRPKGRRPLCDVGRYVDEDVQPLGLLGQGNLL
jgi:hypothetical protein